MALKDNASLALIPAAYKTSKIYSAIPTDGDGDFTFTRSGNATRINKAGLVETMGTNIGRLNYDLTNGTPASCPSLLLEPSRQNKVFPNNSLTGYSTIGVTTSNNQTTAPNGANEGAEVQATTSGTAVVFKGFIGTSGVTHNISAFVKAGTHNQVRLQEGFSASNIDVNLSNGNIIANSNSSNLKVEEYPNNWYRVSFNFTSSGTNLQFALYFNGSYSSGENVYLYGGQIEEGAYSTSIIPTSGSAVTRTVDKCFNGGDVDLFNFTEGTFFIDVNPFIPSANTNIGISNGTDAQKIVFIFQSYGTQVRTYSSGGVSEYDNLTFNQRNKIAVSFKTNEYKIFINGTKVGTDTLASVPTGMNRLNFSNRSNSSSYFEGEIYQTMVFNEALSDSELQALTT